MPSITNKNTYFAPYWGKSTELKSGLNQLGIRNVSEYLFSRLLPGLNNVSDRIRYYSFYCWLLNEFYKGKEEASEKEFQVFLRRCELLMAMICSVQEDAVGIPGITYATNLTRYEGSPYSLQKGIYNENGTTNHTYWSNPGGIFRQYYSASLEELAIIGLNANGRFYNITTEDGFINGKELAHAFASSFYPKTLKTFLKIVESGTVKIEQLEALAPLFKMKAPIDAPIETQLLLKMLLQKDRPMRLDDDYCNRRNTIKYALEYLHKGSGELEGVEFSKYMYEQYHSKKATDITAWGWYAYFLDDNWQYQATIFLVHLLWKLKNISPARIPVEDIAEEMTNEIISAFPSKGNTKLKRIIESLDKFKQGKDEMADALYSLLYYYRENVDYLEETKQHYREIGATRDNHYKYMQKITQLADLPFHDYVKSYLLEDIIYRHYFVSFTKMRQTGLATQKFSLENGEIRFLEDWFTSHTSPRIETLRRFLQDLDLITSDNTLTTFGLKTLKQLQNEDN